MGLPAKFVGRWVADGNVMQTGYPGSSFSFCVTGATAITMQISNATRIAYRLDDDDYQVLASSSGTVRIQGLSKDTHHVKVVICTSHTTWAGTNYASVSEISVDAGYIYAPKSSKRKILVFGDSITEGWCADDSLTSAPDRAWWNVLSDDLSLDVTPVGIGGIGYEHTSNGDYPAISATPSYIENINKNTVVNDADFDIVLLELGVNDWKSKTEIDFDYLSKITDVLTRIKSKYQKSDIHAMLPFNQNGWPSLKQAYQNSGVHIVDTDWYDTITFYDSLHPNRAGGRTIAKQISSYLTNYYESNYFMEDDMKRIDMIYLDKNGNVQKVSSASADTPLAPSVPSDGIKVSEVTVTSSSTSGNLIDERKWMLRYYNSGCISVKDYGAKGDGVTDDTSAIQKTIDNNPGKTIYFPDGEYLISSSIVTSSTDEDKSILNLGNATIKASDSFQSAAYMIELGRKGGPSYGWSGAPHRSGVMGGRLNGNKAAYGGIHVTHMDNAFLDSVYIEAVQQIGISVEEPSLECNSSAADLKHVFVTGSGKKGSVGIKLNGCDNKLTHIKVFAFETGMEINAGGDYINICHVLGWLAYEDKNDIGFILNGGDIHLDNCYSDGFSTALYQDENCKRGIINNIFVLFNSNLSGANETFLKVKTGRPKIFVIRANVHFNTANNPTVYDGELNLSSDTNNNHVFYQCSFKNANLTDKGIISPLSKDPFLDPYLLSDLDLNNVLCDARFSLKFDGSQAAKKHYPVTSGTYYGMLEVKTYPNGYNVWGSCVQTIYTSVGTKYERMSFSQVLGDTWTPWKTIY